MPDDIDIEDIAQSLSRITRYNGHIKVDHYSVAEHSILLSQYAEIILDKEELGRELFMHDWPEAYCCDIVRPLKRQLEDYSIYERRIWKCICQKFNVPENLSDEVHQLDSAIVANERHHVGHHTLAGDNTRRLHDLPDRWFRFYTPLQAYQQFMYRYRYYFG